MPEVKTKFAGRKIIMNSGKYPQSNVVFAVCMLIKSDFHEFSKVITQNNVGIFIKMAQIEIKRLVTIFFKAWQWKKWKYLKCWEWDMSLGKLIRAIPHFWSALA